MFKKCLLLSATLSVFWLSADPQPVPKSKGQQAQQLLNELTVLCSQAPRAEIEKKLREINQLKEENKKDRSGFRALLAFFYKDEVGDLLADKNIVQKAYTCLNNKFLNSEDTPEKIFKAVGFEINESHKEIFAKRFFNEVAGIQIMFASRNGEPKKEIEKLVAFTPLEFKPQIIWQLLMIFIKASNSELVSFVLNQYASKFSTKDYAVLNTLVDAQKTLLFPSQVKEMEELDKIKELFLNKAQGLS